MGEESKQKYYDEEKKAKEKFNAEMAEFEKSAPAKSSGKEKSKKKKEKSDENKPKRAWPPFFFFQSDKREILRKENPDKNHKEIVALLGEEWRKLSDEAKKPYVEKSNVDKKRYEQEKKEMKQSKVVLINPE
jgi:hypothetical protein